MAIRTTIQPFLFYRDIVIAVLCLIFGVWGWYDYSVSIPAREAAFAEYTDLVTQRDGLEKQALVAALSSTDQEELTAIKARLAKDFLEAPVPVPSYDRMLQFWVYFIGCGVLGTPWALWSLVSLRRRSFAITEDGTLVTPEGSCPVGEVRDIDMSRWMSKSIAVVTLANGTTSLLDDYKYRNVHRIVGAIAHRLYPTDWTVDAKMVKKKTADTGASAEDEAPAAS